MSIIEQSIKDREFRKFRESSDRVGEPAVDVVVGNNPLAIGKDYDKIDVTYPTATTEVYDYLLSGSSVFTVRVTYSNSSKENIVTIEVIQ